MTQAVLEQIRSYYLDFLPFNKVLGIDIDLLEYDTGKARVRFPMKPDLIGNSAAGILHGGVTAAVIDLTGGLSALITCVKYHESDSQDRLYKRLTASATIDMRVDYLRPGKGTSFVCTSRILRAGSRIVVSRMDLVNDRKQCIATGTGTYLIG